MTKNGTLVGVGVLLLAGTGVMALMPTKQDVPSPVYNEVEARAKLAKLANSIKLYRQEIGYGPIETWVTPADAGLPPNMMVLARPGHAWSLEGGMADLKLSTCWPNTMFMTQMYPLPTLPLDSNAYWPLFMETLKRRGDKTPLFVDGWYGSQDKFKGLAANRQQAFLVIRLNGDLDEVTALVSPSPEILEK